MCVPGLNCYSCPAATGACPIGAFQAVVGSSKFKFTYYITGFFILLGVLLGRFICGFLCPFGWFQDLLHKIPGKKFSTAKMKPLRYLKYVILVVFVILLPAFVTNSLGMGDPFFCKYICPQGVLEGALPLVIRIGDRVVDLPHPDGPTKMMNSLSSISRLKSLTAWKPFG